jgi:hypothetical protein
VNISQLKLRSEKFDNNNNNNNVSAFENAIIRQLKINEQI